MCPNGVEWKPLGEVISRSSQKVRNKKVPVYCVSNSKGLILSDSLHNFAVYSDDISNYLLIEKNMFAYNPSRLNIGSIACMKENVGAVSPMYVVFSVNMELINIDYAYYFLKSHSVNYQINNMIEEGARFRFTFEKWNNISIPLPPLAIQTRIVEILDHFTNLTANLTAELNLRRKQFEHYREKLLSLDGVEMVKLFDVAKNSTGLTYKPSDVSDSGTLVLRSSNIQNSMLCFDDNVFVKMKSIPTRALVKENDILVCVRNGSSSLIGKAAIIDKSCEGMAFGAFMTILRAFNINYKYLFYVWQSDRIQKMVHGDSGAPINQITNAVLDKIMIPYPSEDTQHSIVSILDKFTALIENIEKELALRQKQYEYYREELLRFGG